MKKHTIQGTLRTIIGRKAKNVRTDGFILGTIYGKNTENITIQVPTDVFTHTFKETGETGLIELVVEGKNHPVLVKQVQFHPVTAQVLNVEFLEVNLKEKIKANVPVILTGESPAVKEGTGTVLHLINEIEVEALPADLPEHIEIDVTPLVAVDDQIMVKDLSVSADVTVLTDPEIIVVKIGQLTAPEPEPVVEVAPVEGEATPAPVEGEEAKPKEAPKEEEK